MSLIRLRLDISNLLSTKKEPWRRSARAFSLLSTPEKDHERSEQPALRYPGKKAELYQWK